MNFADQEPSLQSTVASDAANDALDHLLRAAAHVRLRLGELLEQFALTEARYSILVALRIVSRAGLSQSELAERLMQSESNISTLIDRMQQEGLVDRLRSDADRRKRVLLLSPSGERLLYRVEAAKRKWATRVLRVIPTDSRSTLGPLMKQLSERLEGTIPLKPGTPAAILDQVDSSIGDVDWPESEVQEREEVNSPHLALRQMLSALGLTDQTEEDKA